MSDPIQDVDPVANHQTGCMLTQQVVAHLLPTPASFKLKMPAGRGRGPPTGHAVPGCRYVQEYLAIGEAPDQIRNCYQQRSRWCKVGTSLPLLCSGLHLPNAVPVITTLITALLHLAGVLF